MKFTRRVLRVLRACAGGQQACACQRPAVRCACCGGLRGVGAAEPVIVGRPCIESDTDPQRLQEPAEVRKWRNPAAPSHEALAARDAHLAQAAQARSYLAASARTHL